MTDRPYRPWWHILLEGATQYLVVARATRAQEDNQQAAFWYRLHVLFSRLARYFGSLALAAEVHYWKTVAP